MSTESEHHTQPATNAGGSHPGRRKKQPGTLKSKLPFFLAAIILPLFAGIVAYSLLAKETVADAIDSSKYQVVVIRDGSSTPNYFGKLSVIDEDYMRLTNVYYLSLKADSDAESSQAITSQNLSDYELIKLGNEVHGPEDEIIIPTSQILYFENLKPDGTVSQTITNAQKE